LGRGIYDLRFTIYDWGQGPPDGIELARIRTIVEWTRWPRELECGKFRIVFNQWPWWPGAKKPRHFRQDKTRGRPVRMCCPAQCPSGSLHDFAPNDFAIPEFSAFCFFNRWSRAVSVISN
jgi:hypothetical protein